MDMLAKPHMGLIDIMVVTDTEYRMQKAQEF